MTEPAAHTSLPTPELRVIPRDVHDISRKQMSPNALRVLYRLREAGFGGYLVGGAVRDLLVGGAPKDFDVATDATPEQVKALFRNCRLIGRRFRLAHVVQAGWKPAAGSEATAAASGGQCLQLKATDSIAPKAKIIRERAKLEAAIVLPFGFTFASPAELKA